MTRRAAKLAAVYLLLGLAATWAVGLGSRWLPTKQYLPATAPRRTDPQLIFDLYQSAAADRVQLRGRIWLSSGSDTSGEYTQALPPGCQHLFADAVPLGEGAYRGTLVIQTVGWPWRALRYEVAGVAEGWSQSPPESYREIRFVGPFGFRTGLGTEDPATGLDSLDALPWGPLWPGLLADTVFYALLLAGLHQLTAWGRRARRRRRGRCAVCGYDLTGIDGVCPECGAAR